MPFILIYISPAEWPCWTQFGFRLILVFIFVSTSALALSIIDLKLKQRIRELDLVGEVNKIVLKYLSQVFLDKCK